MNEHMDYFKCFSRCYLMWSHSNFDRIARETANKHLAIYLQEKEERKLNSEPYLTMRNMFKRANDWFAEQDKDLVSDSAFLRGVQWEPAPK